MNAATNVKQIQGNHTPITPFVGFIALMAIALVGCAIVSSAVMSLTGSLLRGCAMPHLQPCRVRRRGCSAAGGVVVLFAVAAGLTYLVSHK